MKIIKSKNNTNDNNNTLTYGVHDTIRVHTNTIRFQKLYDTMNLWKRYMIASIVGVFMSFVILFLLKNTGLYNSGLSGFLQGLSRLIYVLICKNVNKSAADTSFNFLFWGLYLLLNIPLLIFSWIKIGKNFTKLTFIFLLVSTIVGICISFIPGIDKVYIFGNTLPYGKDAGDLVHLNNVFSEYGVYNLPFYFNDHTGGTFFNMQYDTTKSLMLLLYGISYGILSASCYAILYIIGACSGGMDYIGIYYATKKQKPLGATLVAFNSITLFIGTIIGSYIPSGYINSVGWHWEFLFSSNLISSLLGVFVFGLLLNRLYPINKRVRIDVYSKNGETIRDHLFNAKYPHTLTFVDVEGAFSKNKYKSLFTICSYIELPRLINQISKIDKDAFISVTSIYGVEGNMAVYRQGSI